MSDLTNSEYLIQLAQTKMPFGKYAGRYLIDLPETYLLWFKNQGFPAGKLGLMMQEVLEIQLQGNEALLHPLKSLSPKP